MIYSLYLKYYSNLHSFACIQCIKKVVGEIDKLKDGKAKIYDFVYVSLEFKKTGKKYIENRNQISFVQKMYNELNDVVFLFFHKSTYTPDS